MAAPAQHVGHVGKAPVAQRRALRFVLEGADHFPALVVEQDDDRVQPQARAVAQLPARHLEGAVAHQNQAALTRGHLGANAGGHAKAHGGVVAGGHQGRGQQLHGGKQAVAHVRDDVHRPVREDAVVQRPAQIARAQRRVVGHQAARVFGLGRQGAPRAAGGRNAFEQRLDQRGQRNVVVHVVAHAHLAVRGNQRAAEVHALGAHAKVAVGQNGAQHHGQVRFIEQRRGFGRPRHTQVGAVQINAVFGQQAPAHEGGEHGQLQAARQLGHARLDAKAAHFHIDHHHRVFGGVDARQPFVSSLGHGLGVEAAGRQHGHLAHGLQRHVARNFD